MRRTLIWWSLALLLTALPAPPSGHAQDAEVRDLEAGLLPIREQHGVPALGGAIVRSSGLTSLGVVGVRTAGGETAATRGDLWHIGSNTKAMTATLLARLHEQDVLPLETNVVGAVKGVEAHEGWAGATLRLLLGNRGGAVGDTTKLPVWLQLWRHDGKPKAARRLLLKDLLSREPEAQPGTKYVYSNAGFAIAGHIAETKAGKSYEALMQREVFRPLGIETAGFGAPGKKTRVSKPDQPWGHRGQGEPVPVPPGPAADNPPGIAPAGGVHLTLIDWARFARAHLRGARGDGGEYLKADTFRTLHTPLEGQQYALGWIVSEQPWGEDGKKIRVLNHNGSNTMWYASIWVAPDLDAAFLAVCNIGGDRGRSACNDVIRRLVTHELR